MAQVLTQRIASTIAFEEALKRAQQRAAHSYFDQHVIEETDGNYTTFDEGDYNALPAWMIDKIAYTVPGQMADEY